jgi:hypothetical protein
LDTEKAFHEHIGFLLLFLLTSITTGGKCISFRLLSCTVGASFRFLHSFFHFLMRFACG